MRGRSPAGDANSSLAAAEETAFVLNGAGGGLLRVPGPDGAGFSYVTVLKRDHFELSRE
jgi:hypothetical protein